MDASTTPTGASRIHLRPADPVLDLELVHAWMQEPHVAPWWGLRGAPDTVRAHLACQAALEHTDAWIGYAGRTPFAYVETYRAAADPLAAHYPARPGDRGWHVLVGLSLIHI